ncbi:MAG: clostripain-related cysteine peptidase [Bacilli bacterium]|nr:clostripain-related cysteine peptidase [Bacilli bacterium]
MKKFAKVFILLTPLVLSSCDFGNVQIARQLSISDQKAFDYHIGEVFDDYVNAGGLKVNVIMSDDSVLLAEKGTFTYQITEKNNPDKTIDGTKPFTTAGNYIVTVSKEKLPSVSENITVLEKEDPQPTTVTLSSISASDYTKEVYQNEAYTFDGKVTAKYSDGSTKDVTSKATIGTISTTTLGDKSLSISYTEDNITKTTSAKITVIEKGVDPVVKTLSKIDASGYKTSVYQNETYTFNGIVTATYSDTTTANVTSKASIGTISTSTTGTKTATISYTENGVTKTTNYSVNVEEKEPSYETITPEQAISICEDLGSAVVSDKEYYVKGIAEDVTYSKQYDNYSGKFQDSNFYFTQTNSNNLVSSTSDVDGKEVIIRGYLELYNSKYQLPYLPASSSPTGSAYHSKFIEVKDVPVEKILVTNVSFTLSSKTMNVGDTFTVSYTVSPSNATNKSLSWSSSNTTVASVSNGVVTAKAAGTTTITAKSTDGSNKQASLTVTVTKVDVAVTDISLDKSTLSIQKGKTAQLTATISPSNATDKEVTWSGSANGINVNSSGLVSVSSTATVGTKATIVATAHGNIAKTASCVVTVTEAPVVEKDAWTIMIYMCGSTLEYDPEYPTDGGYASEDIVEILKSNAIPDDVNILIETGGAGDWELASKYITNGKTSISSSKLQRWEIVSKKDSSSNNKLSFVKELNTNQLSSQSSFESFLEWGLTDYPAENTGVIMWNHGGALGGVCYDENYTYPYEYEHKTYYYPNSLNCSEVAQATKQALANTGGDKMTFIGYDACLMSVADIATVNSDYYKYMVASQESEPGYGWDYTTWLNNLYNNKDNTTSKIQNVLDKICSSFLTHNCDNGGCGEYDSYYHEYYYCYSTLSVLDLSKADALVSAFETYATNIKKISGYYNKIKNAFNNAKNYGFGEGIYGVVDFVKFLEYMDKQFSSVSSTNVKNVITSLVISKYNCDEYNYTPCGVNAFVPEITDTSGDYGLQCEYEDYEGEYATKFSTWQEIMLANWY